MEKQEFVYVLGYQTFEGAFEPYFFCDSFEEAAEIDGDDFDYKGEDRWEQRLRNYDKIVILKVPSKATYVAKKEAERKASEELYRKRLAEGYYDDDEEDS